MSKGLKDIIAALSQNEEYSKYTYVGKNYTKQDLIDDLLALRANYPYTIGDFKRQMDNEISIDAVMKSAIHKGKGKAAKARAAKVERLIDRGGSRCFYCGRELERNEITIEHLKAKANGGGSGLNNLKISCKPCNVKVGNLSVKEKMKLSYTSDEGFIVNYSDYT